MMQPLIRGRRNLKRKSAMKGAKDTRMAPDMKPIRTELRELHGQEVEVKIYPTLKEYLDDA